MNVFLYAIPVFFAFIALELLVSKWQGVKVYAFNDTINDLACGMLQLLTGVLTKLVIVAAYVWLFRNARFIDWGPITGNTAIAVHLLAFFGIDLCYYWSHRMSHEWNFFWAQHVVHHQSEEYNLAVALRQSALHGFSSWLFYMPMALLGVPPLIFFIHKAINLLYQFFIHTRLVGKLGFLEWFFNTPSHHRVHHARNVKYLDRNYGGILIIWDRLFGSFMEEQEEPTYGVTKALESWNPIWANLHTWAFLRGLAQGARKGRDKLLLWVMPPAWMPEGMGALTERSELDTSKFDSDTPLALKLYISVHFVTTVLALVATLTLSGLLPGLWLLSACLWIAGSLTLFGGIAEGKRWAPLSEFVRLLLTLGWLGWLLSASWWLLLVPVLALPIVGVWLSLLAECRSHFLPRYDSPSDSEAARLFLAERQRRQAAMSAFPTRPGDAASTILSGRWT